LQVDESRDPGVSADNQTGAFSHIRIRFSNIGRTRPSDLFIIRAICARILLSLSFLDHNVGRPFTSFFERPTTMSPLDHLQTASPPTPVPQSETNIRKAKVSFMLGLSSFLVSFLAGVPAIINGLLGLKEIRRSGGRLQGRSLALWGIALGLAGSLTSGSLILYTAARVREASRRLDVV
jgi:hypothetical protein